MSDTPIYIPTAPRRVLWLVAAITTAGIAWLLVVAASLLVYIDGWPIITTSVTLGLAITTSVCAVQLSIAHVDRCAVSEEHVKMLRLLQKEIEKVSDRVGKLEWQVCERTPSEVLEANQPTVPIPLLAPVLHINGRQ